MDPNILNTFILPLQMFNLSRTFLETQMVELKGMRRSHFADAAQVCGVVVKNVALVPLLLHKHTMSPSAVTGHRHPTGPDKGSALPRQLEQLKGWLFSSDTDSTCPLSSIVKSMNLHVGPNYPPPCPMKLLSHFGGSFSAETPEHMTGPQKPICTLPHGIKYNTGSSNNVKKDSVKKSKKLVTDRSFPSTIQSLVTDR